MTHTKRYLTAAILLAGALTASQVLAFDEETKTTDKSLAEYESVYIAPVALDLDLDVRYSDRGGGGDRPISERDQVQKADDLYDDLNRAFAKSFKLTAGGGVGVLTVEATLTDLASTKPTKADFDRTPQLSLSSVYAGGAAFEVELSEDGTTLAEISDSEFGNLGDGQIRSGIWRDADRAFSKWSRQLVKYVQKN